MQLVLSSRISEEGYLASAAPCDRCRHILMGSSIWHQSHRYVHCTREISFCFSIIHGWSTRILWISANFDDKDTMKRIPWNVWNATFPFDTTETDIMGAYPFSIWSRTYASILPNRAVELVPHTESNTWALQTTHGLAVLQAWGPFYRHQLINLIWKSHKV